MRMSMRPASDLTRPGLTRTARARAGWCLALLYLTCVLLPGLSLTLAADPARAAPCIEQVIATPTYHAEAAHVAGHEHAGLGHTAPGDGPGHAAAPGGDHHHGAISAMATDVAVAAGSGDRPSSHHHTSPGPCCAMMCLSALPAAPAELALPAAVTSRRTPDIARSLSDAAPSRRDRPPMA